MKKINGFDLSGFCDKPCAGSLWRHMCTMCSHAHCAQRFYKLNFDPVLLHSRQYKDRFDYFLYCVCANSYQLILRIYKSWFEFDTVIWKKQFRIEMWQITILRGWYNKIIHNWPIKIQNRIVNLAWSSSIRTIWYRIEKLGTLLIARININLF